APVEQVTGPTTMADLVDSAHGLDGTDIPSCPCASSSMAEQRTLNPQVQGSNPWGRTMADERTRPSTVAAGAALVGAALLGVSAFLVWGSLDIKIGTISEKGTDSAAGFAVIALAVAVVALLVGWFAGLPARFVRIGWLLFGLGAVGLS